VKLDLEDLCWRELECTLHACLLVGSSQKYETFPVDLGEKSIFDVITICVVEKA
jgi:hypothetical protein